MKERKKEKRSSVQVRWWGIRVCLVADKMEENGFQV
jgi:hypothetical protein